MGDARVLVILALSYRLLLRASEIYAEQDGLCTECNA